MEAGGVEPRSSHALSSSYRNELVRKTEDFDKARPFSRCCTCCNGRKPQCSGRRVGFFDKATSDAFPHTSSSTTHSPWLPFSPCTGACGFVPSVRDRSLSTDIKPPPLRG